jgi:hypothetical protein
VDLVGEGPLAAVEAVEEEDILAVAGLVDPATGAVEAVAEAI